MHGLTMAKSGQLLEEKQWFDIRRDFPIKTKDNTNFQIQILGTTFYFL